MDFDDAYANMAHIPNAKSFITKWPERAAAFRANWPQKQLDIAYGDDPRQRFDLFLPDGPSLEDGAKQAQSPGYLGLGEYGHVHLLADQSVIFSPVAW